MSAPPCPHGFDSALCSACPIDRAYERGRREVLDRLKAADARCANQRRELSRLNAQVAALLAEIRTLRGFPPMLTVEESERLRESRREAVARAEAADILQARAEGTIRGLWFRMAESEDERVALADYERLQDLCCRIDEALPDFDAGDALCGALDDGVRLVVAQRELGLKREERLREALRTIILENTIHCDGYECAEAATYQAAEDRWCAACLESAKKAASKWGRKFEPKTFEQPWAARVAREALEAVGESA